MKKRQKSKNKSSAIEKSTNEQSFATVNLKGPEIFSTQKSAAFSLVFKKPSDNNRAPIAQKYIKNTRKLLKEKSFKMVRHPKIENVKPKTTITVYNNGTLLSSRHTYIL